MAAGVVLLQLVLEIQCRVASLQLTRQQCANAVRRIGQRVREALRDVLRDDGERPERIDEAVREVLAVLGSG